MAKHPILGISQASAQQLIAFVRKINDSFNPDIARAFLTIGRKYGVRGDIAFCQSIHETNWFRYGGDVQADQNNYSGLGATGGVPGARFPTIEAGVTAQIQHLFAYATAAALPAGDPLIDPRFHLVTRGSAPFWEDLGGKWAVPGYPVGKYTSFASAYQAGETYGQQIMKLYDELIETQPVKGDDGYPEGTPDWKKEAVDWMFDMGLLTNTDWKKRVEEPLPLWAEAVVLKKLMEKK